MAGPNTRLAMQASRLYTDCPHVSDTNYGVATGITVAATAYTPTDAVAGGVAMMNGLLLGCVAGGAAATGNVSVILEGGGIMTVPFAVAANDSIEAFRGLRIVTIRAAADGTDFTGRIWPLF